MPANPRSSRSATDASSSRPRIERIGHRGAPREITENTLPSFERAFDLGADGVELDVHVTADGTPVVHHDPDVAIQTRPRRVTRPIATMTWKELSCIEFSPGLTIPTLEAVLALSRDRGTVYVELKGRGVEQRALAVIRASGARCAVHSFDHEAVKRSARLAPEIPRGVLFDEYPRNVVGSMRDVSARDVWPHWQLIDRTLVERVHNEGGRVIAWTVNAPSTAQELERLGVDGLCGDDLRLLELGSAGSGA
jgi:glycerophosphoryl diester phosphodiesterase